LEQSSDGFLLPAVRVFFENLTEKTNRFTGLPLPLTGKIFKSRQDREQVCFSMTIKYLKEKTGL